MKKRHRFFPVWIKLYLIFALVLFIGFFFTVAIAYLCILNRMSAHVRDIDRHAASFLACRMEQVLSATPINEVLTPIDRGKGEFPFHSQFKPSHVASRLKKDSQSIKRPKDHFFKEFPKMIDRLMALQAHYGSSNDVELFATLVQDYWALFASRHSQKDSTPTLVVYLSPTEKILYSSRDCLPFEFKRSQRAAVFVEEKIVGYVLVNSFKGIFLNKNDSFLLKTILISVILALFIGLFIMGILSFVLIRRWFLPLTHIRNEIGKIVKGEQIFLPIGKNRDEFTLLAKALNSMSGRLHELENQRKQMLVDISHELRTPVALLNTRLEMISKGCYEVDEKQIDFMLQNLSKLSNLIDQVHQLSILESVEASSRMEDFDFISVIKEEMERFSDLAKEKNIDFKLKTTVSNCLLSGSVKSARMAISNILANAFRYVEAEDKIYISLAREDQQVVLSISDSGIGVDEDKLPFLFDRFYRADSSRSRSSGGSGIGLALVKAWANSLQAQVVAFNNDLGGLTIEVRI